MANFEESIGDQSTDLRHVARDRPDEDIGNVLYSKSVCRNVHRTDGDYTLARSSST